MFILRNILGLIEEKDPTDTPIHAWQKSEERAAIENHIRTLIEIKKTSQTLHQLLRLIGDTSNTNTALQQLGQQLSLIYKTAYEKIGENIPLEEEQRQAENLLRELNNYYAENAIQVFQEKIDLITQKTQDIIASSQYKADEFLHKIENLMPHQSAESRQLTSFQDDEYLFPQATNFTIIDNSPHLQENTFSDEDGVIETKDTPQEVVISTITEVEQLQEIRLLSQNLQSNIANKSAKIANFVAENKNNIDTIKLLTKIHHYLDEFDTDYTLIREAYKAFINNATKKFSVYLSLYYSQTVDGFLREINHSIMRQQERVDSLFSDIKSLLEKKYSVITEKNNFAAQFEQVKANIIIYQQFINVIIARNIDNLRRYAILHRGNIEGVTNEQLEYFIKYKMSMLREMFEAVHQNHQNTIYIIEYNLKYLSGKDFAVCCEKLNELAEKYRIGELDCILKDRLYQETPEDKLVIARRANKTRRITAVTGTALSAVVAFMISGPMGAVFTVITGGVLGEIFARRSSRFEGFYRFLYHANDRDPRIIHRKPKIEEAINNSLAAYYKDLENTGGEALSVSAAVLISAASSAVVSPAFAIIIFGGTKKLTSLVAAKVPHAIKRPIGEKVMVWRVMITQRLTGRYIVEDHGEAALVAVSKKRSGQRRELQNKGLNLLTCGLAGIVLVGGGASALWTGGSLLGPAVNAAVTLVTAKTAARAYTITHSTSDQEAILGPSAVPLAKLGLASIEGQDVPGAAVLIAASTAIPNKAAKVAFAGSSMALIAATLNDIRVLWKMTKIPPERREERIEGMRSRDKVKLALKYGSVLFIILITATYTPIHVYLPAYRINFDDPQTTGIISAAVLCVWAGLVTACYCGYYKLAKVQRVIDRIMGFVGRVISCNWRKHLEMSKLGEHYLVNNKWAEGLDPSAPENKPFLMAAAISKAQGRTHAEVEYIPDEVQALIKQGRIAKKHQQDGIAKPEELAELQRAPSEPVMIEDGPASPRPQHSIQTSSGGKTRNELKLSWCQRVLSCLRQKDLGDGSGSEFSGVGSLDSANPDLEMGLKADMRDTKGIPLPLIMDPTPPVRSFNRNRPYTTEEEQDSKEYSRQHRRQLNPARA